MISLSYLSGTEATRTNTQSSLPAPSSIIASPSQQQHIRALRSWDSHSSCYSSAYKPVQRNGIKDRASKRCSTKGR
ncbi:unnamed protein product [Vitrella brassicaformis CCMP3155]|uniref:Uncharacterized protein n=1 Tax=Vitrella brassicaformis (strain CCMP3155) TaxID=1169540 RepID=A0A0G4GBV0_VITBC|nr:unnamed protein product [Vitrella brassicaformis CCMP3155]|eukprot:CEM26578.1 unnamed protein product [Vitrella brassicaformis CCMP3155]